MPGSRPVHPTWLLELAGTAYLLLPLLGGALAHGLCMRRGWLAWLRRPIDAGLTWRGRPIFGASKTWRGPVTVAAGAALVLALQARVLHHVPGLRAIELFDYGHLGGALLGAGVGAAAELAELPNSFVKRRLGVAPGGTTRGPLAVVFFLWDQLDVLVGFWLAFAIVVEPTLLRVAFSAGIAVTIHPLMAVAGYWLGMRATPR